MTRPCFQSHGKRLPRTRGSYEKKNEFGRKHRAYRNGGRGDRQGGRSLGCAPGGFRPCTRPLTRPARAALSLPCAVAASSLAAIARPVFFASAVMGSAVRVVGGRGTSPPGSRASRGCPRQACCFAGIAPAGLRVPGRSGALEPRRPQNGGRRPSAGHTRMGMLTPALEPRVPAGSLRQFDRCQGSQGPTAAAQGVALMTARGVRRGAAWARTALSATR